MIRVPSQESANAATIRALCLLLAGLLWLSVIVERPAETRLQVPVLLERVPAGLRVVSPPPGQVEVTVSGPRIALWLLPYRKVSCRIDLAGATAGAKSYTVQDATFRLLDGELKVVRVHPATVPLELAKS